MNAVPVQPEPEPRPAPEGEDRPQRAAVTGNVDPEDWAGSPGSSEEWLLRERPPHW